MSFFHTMIRALATAMAMACGLATCLALEPPVRIMPLGDSITYGVTSGDVEGGYRTQLHSLLSNAGYNVDFVGTFSDTTFTVPDRNHQGLRGAHVDGLDLAVGGWLDSVEDPDVVLLLVGTNDFLQTWPYETPAGVLAELDSLINNIATRRPFAKIIVSTLILSTVSPTIEAKQVTFNQGIPALVAQHVAQGRHVSMVDMHPVLNAGDLADTVHPTTGGYNMMANAWFPKITDVISPKGSANPPCIARTVPGHSSTQLSVDFSKPVADDAVNLANFSLSGGLTVSNAVLDPATKRTITLTTSAQTPGLVYTLTVDGVRDRTTQQTLIAPQSKASFARNAVINGSFEDNFPMDMDGWTRSGNVWHQEGGSGLVPTHGANVASFNGGNTTPNGILSRNFATVAGQTYTLSFDMGVYSYATTNQQRLEVSVQGATTLVNSIVSLNGLGGYVASSNWTSRNFSFVANSATTTLSFSDDSNHTNNIDLLLDNVRVGIPPTTRSLAVTSTPAGGVNMTLSPVDRFGNGNGLAGMIRSYAMGSSVTVTAPASIPGKNFVKWQKNGADMPGSNLAITVAMNSDHALNAVYEVDDVPIADAQSQATNEDTPLGITLTGSDDDEVELAFNVVVGPAHGILQGTAPNLTYLPASNYHGPDGFTFTVNDGTLTSAQATVAITVNPVNDDPLASAQSLATDEDTALPITLTGGDVDGDSLVFVVTGGPGNGQLTGTAPNLTYTPDANYHGSDSFIFTVSDGTAAPVEATISITVNPVNDAPLANAQSLATDEDAALPITLTGGDVDGDSL
ncbi:MAG: Ig-like domain-containing protein, partial [Luteolibacter sp.]|nr:Ig-like domain-containing protein [Luteolibacter sp.]